MLPGAKRRTEDPVTAEAQAEPDAEHAALPSLTLSARQLGDLELILSGAFAPLAGFMTAADVSCVASSATLADGTPWPVPVTLEVPADKIAAADRQVLLADPEGTPLAVLTITERTPAADDRVLLAGPVRANRVPEHGSFRRLMISPAQGKAEFGERPVLAFATSAPLSARQIGQLKHLSGQLGARLLVLPLVASAAEVVKQPESLIRAVLAAAGNLPPGTLVVPVPYAERAGDRARDVAATAIVAAAYGATHLMAEGLPGSAGLPVQAGAPGAENGVQTELLAAPIPVLAAGEWAYDPAAEVWRPLALIEAGTEIEDLTPDQLADLLDAGAEIPTWFASKAVAT